MFFAIPSLPLHHHKNNIVSITLSRGICPSDTKSRSFPAPLYIRHRREGMRSQEASPALRIFCLLSRCSQHLTTAQKPSNTAEITSGCVSVTDETP